MQLTELTEEQKAEIDKIMAEAHCSADFPCYESGFEDLTPVRVFSYGPVECLRAREAPCPMSTGIDLQDGRCECPLRQYAAKSPGKLPGRRMLRNHCDLACHLQSGTATHRLSFLLACRPQ